MSALPSDTASKLSKAPTNSPAARTLIVIWPSVRVLIRSANRSALTPKPGKFFGQAVTILRERFLETTAGAPSLLDSLDPLHPARAAAATAPVATVPRNCLRFIDCPVQY